MTTVVVVRKAGQVAIAADTLVTFGDTRLTHRLEDNSKIFKVDTPGGVTYIGMAGTVAHFPVLRKALADLPREQLRLSSKADVFETFMRLHPILKEKFFLQTKEDDGDPMLGASKNVFNLIGYFENDKLNARIAYNYRSHFFNGIDRLSAFNQDDTRSVSASLGWTFNQHFAITLDGMNLTNEKLKYYADNKDQPRGIYNNGRQYYLNVRFKF